MTDNPGNNDTTPMQTLYLPSDLEPEPGMDERAFWANCAQRRLAFQRCGACGHYRHPPVPICPACHSDRIEWTEAPAQGEVYSYTIVHHPSHPAMKACVPYNVAVVAFAGLGDVRLITNVIDAAPEQMAIGMKVQLHWEGPIGGHFLPRFRKAESAT